MFRDALRQNKEARQRRRMVAPMIILIFVLVGVLVSGAMAKTQVDPRKYLATLNFASGEFYFPVRYDFDGDNDVSNNVQNYAVAMVGGPGTRFGPIVARFDQRPTVYFNLVEDVRVGSVNCQVYEYWLYYVHNLWIKPHMQDWECYFVYESKGRPVYVGMGYHEAYHLYPWSAISSVEGHPFLHVDGGSHSLRTGRQNLGQQPPPSPQELAGILQNLERIYPYVPNEVKQLLGQVDQTTRPRIFNMLDNPSLGTTITHRGQVEPKVGGRALPTVNAYMADWHIIRVDLMSNGERRRLPGRFGSYSAPWLRPSWTQPPVSSTGKM